MTLELDSSCSQASHLNFQQSCLLGESLESYRESLIVEFVNLLSVFARVSARKLVDDLFSESLSFVLGFIRRASGNEEFYDEVSFFFKVERRIKQKSLKSRLISRKLIIFALAFVTISSCVAADENADNENTLKCIVQFLQQKGVSEDFFSSVSQKIDGNVDCEFLINTKLTRAYGKINDKLKADSFFAKYAVCIMNAIKTEGKF